MSRRPAASAAAAGSQPTPIVPPQTVAGRALMLVIAIMTLLSGLTIATVSMIGDAATAWRSDIAREVTIEVRPIDGTAMDGTLDAAVRLAEGAPGVSAARALSDDETKRLLEPWLGSGADLSALPVPRLVVVTIGDPAAFDPAALAAAVEKSIPGGSLDNHGRWIDRLSAMANSVVFAGLCVLVLILAAMALSVVFATNAAMAGNRDVIEVLHFCGAADSFIARQFQRHFLLLGVKGGATGGGLALVVMLVLGWWLGRSTGQPGADQFEALAGGFELRWTAFAAVLGLIAGVALLTAATSRLAVRRSLSAMT